MDISRVPDVLAGACTYQYFEKHVFIERLGNVLDEFIQDGDTYLNSYDGFCNSKTCNQSENYFNLIIDIKDGVIL